MEKATINGLVYFVDKNDNAVLASTEGLSRPVRNIPAEVEIDGKRHKVRAVGRYYCEHKSVFKNGAFENDKVISHVSFPETVTMITCGAFKNCINLKEVIFSNSIEIIESWSFYGCEQLQELFLGDNLKKIEYEAFCFCSSLQNISFQESLESISGEAFAGCSSLAEVNIPSSVKRIGSKAFADSGVKVVNIYSEDINIAADAFPTDAQINFLDANSYPKHQTKRREQKDVAATAPKPSAPVEIKKELEEKPEKVETPAEKPQPADKPISVKKVEEVKNDLPETDEDDLGFELSSSMTVDALCSQFNTRFGSVLRVYEGRSKADGFKKLNDVGLTQNGILNCRGNLTVGSFIGRAAEFGLKVKVYTCDEWVAVLDGLTLQSSGMVKKNAVKADMESMIAYQRDNNDSSDTSDYSVTKNTDGSYTVTINGQVQSNAKGGMRQIADAIGFEYDSSWTTQQFGAKLSKALSNANK